MPYPGSNSDNSRFGSTSQVMPDSPESAAQLLPPRTPLSEDEQARHQATADFLARLMREGAATQVRSTETDELDERCWYSCRLKEVDRRGNKEPDCKALCYIRTKAKGKQRAPDEDLDSHMARPAVEPKSPWKLAVDAQANTDKRYRFSALEGRYIYRARGNFALAKHAAPALTMEALHDLEELQVTTPPKTVTRGEKLGLVKRAPLVPPNNYEALYPLCSMTASRLQRLHNHVVRIYSPAFRAIAKMPGMLTDGTYFRLSREIYDRGVSGDGLVLGRRLLDLGVENAKKWWERGTGGPGSFGRGGGAGPGSMRPDDGPDKSKPTSTGSQTSA